MDVARMAATAVFMAVAGGCRDDPECHYTEYFDITDSVTIESDRDLEAVAGRCIYVHGDLRFRDWDAVDLSGLEGVVGVSGSVVIARAYALETTRGLDSLEFVGGELRIESNPVLVELDLPQLNGVGRGLYLDRLGVLDSLRGMPELREVGGELVVAELPRLREFDLEGVRYIGGDLRIQKNEGLVVVDGSDDLFEVGGDVAEVELAAGRYAVRGSRPSPAGVKVRAVLTGF